MKIDRAEVLAALLPGAVLGALLAAVAGVLAATLPATERSTVWALLESRFALVFLIWLVAAVAAGTACRSAWLRFGAAPGRLAEDLQVLLATETQRELKADQGSAGSRALAGAVNALVQQRDALRTDMAARVAEASREVEQERNRLAALMAELTQSVVVCNLDGRVLLFNARARLQFRALAAVEKGSPAADKAIGGAEAMGLGLGRSIYGVLDRRLVAHALEAVQQRLQRGAAHPAAQFVTATPGGQLLRVHLAPVRASVESAAPVQSSADSPVAARSPEATADEPLNGFVLMLDNITRDLAEDT
jgi:DNA polymerase-3 subunit epsilon